MTSFGSEHFQRTKDQTQFFDSKFFIEPKLRDSLISFFKLRKAKTWLGYKEIKQPPNTRVLNQYYKKIKIGKKKNPRNRQMNQNNTRLKNKIPIFFCQQDDDFCGKPNTSSYYFLLVLRSIPTCMVFWWFLVHSERFGDVLGICFLSHARVIKTTETCENLLETWTFTSVEPAAAVGNKVNRVLWQRRMWEESREPLKYENRVAFLPHSSSPLKPGNPT
jgi:hypothetical protein